MPSESSSRGVEGVGVTGLRGDRSSYFLTPCHRVGKSPSGGCPRPPPACRTVPSMTATTIAQREPEHLFAEAQTVLAGGVSASMRLHPYLGRPLYVARGEGP